MRWTVSSYPDLLSWEICGLKAMQAVADLRNHAHRIDHCVGIFLFFCLTFSLREQPLLCDVQRFSFSCTPSLRWIDVCHVIDTASVDLLRGADNHFDRAEISNVAIIFLLLRHFSPPRLGAIKHGEGCRPVASSVVRNFRGSLLPSNCCQ